MEATAAADGRGHFELLATAADGSDRLVAAWNDDLRTPELLNAELEVQRSPTGRRVAVQIGARVRTLDLTSGDTVHVDHGDELPPDPVEAGLGGSPILVWGGDEIAAVRVPSDRRPVRATLAPGLQIAIRGPVDDVPGEATSNSGGWHIAFAPGTPDALIDRDLSAHRRRVAEAIDIDRRPEITVVRDGHRTVVQADATSLRRGAERAIWPPLVGPRGVLLRRASVQVHADDPAAGGGRAKRRSSGYSTTVTDVLNPWLVTPDGALHVLPFPLGNGPLATLPDGRFLLPCWQPMWWDGGNEPLSALADDGTAEPLRLDSRPFTPMAAVRAVAPALVPADDPEYDFDNDFDGWRVAAARTSGDGLRLALEPEDPAPGSPWLLVEVPLDGTVCGAPRLIADGVAPANGIVRIIV